MTTDTLPTDGLPESERYLAWVETAFEPATLDRLAGDLAELVNDACLCATCGRGVSPANRGRLKVYLRHWLLNLGEDADVIAHWAAQAEIIPPYPSQEVAA